MKGKVYAFKIIVAEYCLLQCKFHSYLDYESLKNFVALRTSSKHRPVFICSVCYGILGLLLGWIKEKCGEMKARIIEFCYDPVSFNSSQMNEDAIEVYAGNSLSICSFMLFNHSRSFHSFSYPFELFVFCVPIGGPRMYTNNDNRLGYQSVLMTCAKACLPVLAKARFLFYFYRSHRADFERHD